MENKNYRNFGFMMLASFVLMYVIMFLNVDDIDHVYINITRFYMTVMMICAMAILMLAMMPMMYANKRKNLLLILFTSLVFVLAFIGVHKQTGISDIAYMRGMIPHHSIAIMTSKNANITDKRVRKLADGIIHTQVKEIAEMKALIDSLKQKR
jgi:uncharacterized protein (DUF305 family)